VNPDAAVASARVRFEQQLGRARQIDVGDDVARAADEMVMVVVGQLFAELEQRIVAADGEPGHQAGVFEDHQVAVQRALAQPWFGGEDRRNGGRLTKRGQGGDDQLPAPGVAVPSGRTSWPAQLG